MKPSVRRGVQVLVGERRAAHQTVVGVEHDVHAAIVVSAQRVLLIRLHGVRLHVARETDLERDAPVVHVLRERLVLDQTRGVTDAVGAADVHGIAHGRRVGAFAGVTGAREIVLAGIVERRRVHRRGVAELAAGEIEADDAAMLR